MKLFNLSQLAVFKVKTIKNSINLENTFECWIDPIVESSPLSIKVTVAPYCDMYRVSIRLFNLDTEKVIHSETRDLSQVGSVKELVTTLVKDWNVNNPKLKPETEEPSIDIFVTTKHKESAFAWCAESDEYKVFGNTREEAIKEIKEAMALDGIANPALNIINGDYPHQIETPLDTLFDTSELAKKVTERAIISDVNETNRFYYRQDTSKQGVYLTVIATKKNDYFISYVRHNDTSDTGEIIRERKIIERNLSNVITLVGETVERWNRTGQPTPPKKSAINNGDINNIPQSIQPKILHTHQEIKTEHEAIRAKEVMKACDFEVVITNDFLFSIGKKTKEIFFPLPDGELLGLGIQKSREQWVVIAKHLGRVGSHLATRRKEIKKNGFLLDNANQICKELRLFMKIKLTENDEHKLKQLT